MTRNSFFALMLFGDIVLAADSAPDLGKEILEGVSNEYAACSAYYSIVSVGLESSGAVDSAASADKFAELAFNYSYESALAGRSKDMARKVAESRTSLYIQGMSAETEGDMSNVSILTNKYGYRCKKALEDPAAFVDEVSAEIIEKLND